MSVRRRLPGGGAVPAPAALSSEAVGSMVELPGRVSVDRTDNGLTVCVLRNPQAPLVTTALWYRVGTRDEPPGQGGIAHFLEHMMFKGSARYAQGEIDRRTQALGGSNNAFTSHDATAYYFNFARDRWREALAVEADRMAGLTLAPAEVESERRVILEEIAMYESDPWSALDQRVQARLFGSHPYGLPVLGTSRELEATGAAELASFHRHWYRPDNAVLVVAGDVDDSVPEAAARAFSAVPAGSPRHRTFPPARFPGCLERLERRQGEVPRLLLALPAPAGDHPDYPAVRLLTALMASGRVSRLQRALVEERSSCSWVSADVTESLDAGALTVAAELTPGTEPARVEEELLALLDGMVREAPSEAELRRAVRVTLADWVFGHERIHQQALTAGFALSLFDLDHPRRQLQALAGLGPEDVQRTAETYLRPERGAVLGWSLPRAAPSRAGAPPEAAGLPLEDGLSLEDGPAPKAPAAGGGSA